MNDLKNQLGNSIYEIENPSRYFPSEFIIGKKNPDICRVKCAICFPDLYEIGMSNNALRIIYDLINRIDYAYCDRVFSVAPDFEALLREKQIELFTIENQIPLNKLDYLAITMGCELAATNILQVLELGGLSLRTKDRKETDPVVILGGPAATNPIPFSPFVDFVHIGEAEKDTELIVEIMKNFKTRSERIEALKNVPYLWYLGKTLTTRAVDETFGLNEDPVLRHYAVPSFQVAQDHGTVEIMRGCPNGCRFCHAGQYYKPMRQRSINLIEKLVKQNVEEFGYRDITLSSLSSGDYPQLDKLMSSLNSKYKERLVSFSLPSLKVSTFSLDILQELSEVRKSGLTYAIETPCLQNQRSMNKEVPLNQVIEIIKTAKNRGWKVAKFYFMTGLPYVDPDKELTEIVSFISEIYKQTKININLNIGTFIPKPHTPFERAKQMSREDSNEHLRAIKRALMAAVPTIKVSYHEPRISFLEGVISRGDLKTSELIQKAYEKGCRLDAWDEYIDYSKWEESISELNYVFKDCFEENEELPWSGISMNVSKKYLENENLKAKEQILTNPCSENCDHKCGVCSKNGAKIITAQNNLAEQFKSEPKIKQPYQQAVITYSKKGRAVFCSHISVLRQFEMSFQRSGLSVAFTEGFNPKPRMEFLNPISMGVIGENELLLCELPENEINSHSIELLNSNLAEGFTIKDIKLIRIPQSGKKISLASHFEGCLYEIKDIKDNEIENCLEQKILEKSDFFTLTKEQNSYLLKVNGEKNIFKLLFPDTMNKFHIAGSSTITRKEIYLKQL